MSAVRIAHVLGLGHSTVQRVLERHGGESAAATRAPETAAL